MNEGTDLCLISAEEARTIVNTPNRLLHTNVKEMTNDEVLVGWSLLDHVEKTAKKRKDSFRDVLLEVAAEAKPDDKGSHTVAMLGGSVKKEARRSVGVDSELLLGLLNDRGIDPRRGGRLVLNGVDVTALEDFLRQHGKSLEDFGTVEFVGEGERVEQLVADGALTVEEAVKVADVKITYALRVKKPPFVESMIKGATNGRLAEVQLDLLS